MKITGTVPADTSIPKRWLARGDCWDLLEDVLRRTLKAGGIIGKIAIIETVDEVGFKLELELADSQESLVDPAGPSAQRPTAVSEAEAVVMVNTRERKSFAAMTSAEARLVVEYLKELREGAAWVNR